jgi:hypothetical protein
LPAFTWRLLVLVVGGRDFGKEDDVGEGLFSVVADQRVAGFGHDRLVQIDGFLELGMHADPESYSMGTARPADGE